MVHLDGVRVTIDNLAWFNIKKYEILEDVDLCWWWFQFSHRKARFDALEKIDFYTKDYFEKEIMQIKDDPLFKNDAIPKRNWEEKWANFTFADLKYFNEKLKAFSFNQCSVSSISLRKFLDYSCYINYLYYINSGNSKGIFDEKPASPNYSFSKQDFDILRKKTDSLIDFVGFPASAHVIIDLNATDEQIKDDFSLWLTRYKKINKKEIKKDDKEFQVKFKASDYDKWKKYQVLAYLDLIFIKKIQQKEITNTLIARNLYPDYKECENPVKRLKNITEKLSMWLIEESTIKAINAQYISKVDVDFRVFIQREFLKYK
jgi:hypothetical protein